ncbi:MAG TPA: ABC transporter transmembrane domain-containing protein, partial [Tepidisphaeraceae bacterium]|nr:ABC transporter transmembrane domain-containing protein [Tepidisphaeraceae bacterium]
MDRHVSSKQRFTEFRKNPPPPEGAPSAESRGKGLPPLAKPEDRRRYRRDYVRWLKPYRWSLAVLFSLSLVVALLEAVWPLAIRGIGNLLTADLTPAEKVRNLNFFGLAMVVILVFKQIIDSLRDYRIAVLNAKVLFRLRGSLFDKLLSLPLSELGDMKSGGIASRLSGDVDNVSGLVQQAIISPGVAAIRLIIMAGFLLWMTWRLAIPAAAMLTPLAIVSFLWFRRVRPIYRSIREDRTSIDGRATETFGGIRVVRAFRREAHERHDYALGHHTVIRKSLWASILEMMLDIGWGLLLPGTIVLIVWLGGYLFLQGKAEVGDIMAIQLYAMLTIQPVWQIVSSFSQTQRSMAAMERIFAVLEMAPDKPDVVGAVDAPQQLKEFTFENVGFEYRTGVPVIQDFNLNVKGG